METINNIQSVVFLISSILSLGGGLLAVLWVYTKFILERGLLPATQFDIGPIRVGQGGGKSLVEICLHLKNLGTSTLVAGTSGLMFYIWLKTTRIRFGVGFI